MNEINNAVNAYDELKEPAWRVHALAGTVINISRIGPSVLLTDEGFDALFPVGAETEIRVDAEGTRWEYRHADVEGINWTAWKKLQAGAEE